MKRDSGFGTSYLVPENLIRPLFHISYDVNSFRDAESFVHKRC